jgi:hypothetical protein
MWSVRIDALNGKLLEKNDLVISCQFDRDIPMRMKKQAVNLGLHPLIIP